MISWLMAAFVVALEFFCLLFGLGLSEAEASRAAWLEWERALWTIPICGFLGIWLRRRAPGRAQTERFWGGIGSLLGLLLTISWGVKIFTRGSETEISTLRLVAALALMPSLLLLSAGLQKLFAPPPNRVPLSK